MSTWRRQLLEQFPEFGHEPEQWDLIEMSSSLGSMLERAARADDRDTGKRVLSYVLWLEGESKSDDRFVYQCQDVLRGAISSPARRAYFSTLLNQRSLAQLSGYIEYLTSKAALTEIADTVRVNRGGA